MARKLGRVQEAVLKCLYSHRSWSPHCGWVWTGEIQTKKIMDRLVQLGHAREVGGIYYPGKDAEPPKTKETPDHDPEEGGPLSPSTPTEEGPHREVQVFSRRWGQKDPRSPPGEEWTAWVLDSQTRARWASVRGPSREEACQRALTEAITRMTNRVTRYQSLISDAKALLDRKQAEVWEAAMKKTTVCTCECGCANPINGGRCDDCVEFNGACHVRPSPLPREKT